jgi:threonine/homoserine/homoserine lactone efflux protein
LAERRWISLVGSVGLILIGLRTLLGTPAPTLPTGGREKSGPHPDPPPRAGEGKSAEFAATYLSTAALTLSNPPTILSFVAVFAGLGPHVSSGWPSALALVLGVMLGSALWWVALTAIVAAVRERLTARVTRAIGLVSGLALVAAGALISLQSL